MSQGGVANTKRYRPDLISHAARFRHEMKALDVR